MWFWNKKKSGHVLDYFSHEDLEIIKQAIKRGEENTSGEIRVVIRMNFDNDLPYFFHDFRNLDEQALRIFHEHGLHNTKDKTGVLILVILSKRLLKIMADSGIHTKLSQVYWDQYVKDLSKDFRNGNYTQGIIALVDEIAAKLAKFFPRKPDDVNELPDDVVVEDN